MNVTEAVTTRRSIRAFLDTPVNLATITRVMDTARWAASGCNYQPWEASIVTGQPLKDLQAKMIAAVPALGEEGLADVMSLSGGALPKPDSGAKAEGEIAGYPIKDFYLTNAICRASPTMQRCSAELVHGESYAEAAE